MVSYKSETNSLNAILRLFVCLFLCFHRILKIVTITIIVNLRSGLVLVALINSFLGGRAFKTWARIGGVVVGGRAPPCLLSRSKRVSMNRK